MSEKINLKTLTDGDANSSPMTDGISLAPSMPAITTLVGDIKKKDKRVVQPYKFWSRFKDAFVDTLLYEAPRTGIGILAYKDLMKAEETTPNLPKEKKDALIDYFRNKLEQDGAKYKNIAAETTHPFLSFYLPKSESRDGRGGVYYDETLPVEVLSHEYGHSTGKRKDFIGHALMGGHKPHVNSLYHFVTPSDHDERKLKSHLINTISGGIGLIGNAFTLAEEARASRVGLDAIGKFNEGQNDKKLKLTVDELNDQKNMLRSALNSYRNLMIGTGVSTALSLGRYLLQKRKMDKKKKAEQDAGGDILKDKQKG